MRNAIFISSLLLTLTCHAMAAVATGPSVLSVRLINKSSEYIYIDPVSCGNAATLSVFGATDEFNVKTDRIIWNDATCKDSANDSTLSIPPNAQIVISLNGNDYFTMSATLHNDSDSYDGTYKLYMENGYLRIIPVGDIHHHGDAPAKLNKKFSTLGKPDAHGSVGTITFHYPPEVGK